MISICLLPSSSLLSVMIGIKTTALICLILSGCRLKYFHKSSTNNENLQIKNVFNCEIVHEHFIELSAHNKNYL